MADKKLTDVGTSTSMENTDKVFVNIGSAVKQITLANIAGRIKSAIGSLKNPYALTLTGGATGTYDGSEAKSIAIPQKLPNPKTLTFTGAVTGTYDGSEAKTINIPTGSSGSGAQGPAGEDGKSAYEYAQDGGYTGTEEEFAQKLAAEYAEPVERVTYSTVPASIEMQPNKLYDLSDADVDSLSLTLAEPEDTSVAAEYHIIFKSGATATTLTIPDTVNMPSGFSVKANTVYEVSIMENNACVQSWAVSG